ncbi:hypothetical protein H4K36_01930 [Streptomyces sp. DHE7-1]|nr:hypothetical protein [Streptomyces sp. DHE7-1]
MRILRQESSRVLLGDLMGMRRGCQRESSAGPGLAEKGGDGRPFVGGELVVTFVDSAVVLPPAGK